MTRSQPVAPARPRGTQGRRRGMARGLCRPDRRQGPHNTQPLGDRDRAALLAPSARAPDSAGKQGFPRLDPMPRAALTGGCVQT